MIRHFGIGLILIALLSIQLPTVSADVGISGYTVIPTIQGAVYRHALKLVSAGKKLGNRLDVFSKIGDSITRSDYFLVPVGNGGLRLRDYASLHPTVDFYMKTPARTNNSFANLSLAAHAIWSTNEVLNPAQADHSVCLSGETPLDCELRMSRPAVALIMLGTNDVVSVTPEKFRANLDQIALTTEQHGVIPVLSTLPNRLDQTVFMEKIPAYNVIIAQVAAAHADPLWNFWRATYTLKNSGLASTDSIHPSNPDDGNTAIFDADHLGYGMPMRTSQRFRFSIAATFGFALTRPPAKQPPP